MSIFRAGKRFTYKINLFLSRQILQRGRKKCICQKLLTSCNLFCCNITFIFFKRLCSLLIILFLKTQYQKIVQGCIHCFLKIICHAPAVNKTCIPVYIFFKSKSVPNICVYIICSKNIKVAADLCGGRLFFPAHKLVSGSTQGHRFFIIILLIAIRTNISCY